MIDIVIKTRTIPATPRSRDYPQGWWSAKKKEKPVQPKQKEEAKT